VSDDLDFGDGSWIEAKGTVISTLKSLHSSVEGNGKPGIKKDVSDVKMSMATLMAYGRATTFWARVAAALLALALTAAGFYFNWFENHHKVIRQDDPPAVTSRSTFGG
jgi:hypothetical protein